MTVIVEDVRPWRCQKRKQLGNGTGSTLAHPRAALSLEKSRVRPYRVSARGGIQALRVTAHVFARVTNRQNFDVSSLDRSWSTPAAVRMSQITDRKASSHVGSCRAPGSRAARSVSQLETVPV